MIKKIVNESVIPHRLGTLFAWEGSVAQFRGDSLPDPTQPVRRYHFALSKLKAGDYADLLGQVPWSPPGSNSWNGEVRTLHGGRIYVDTDGFTETYVDHPIPRPGRDSKTYVWKWSEVSREWRKTYR